MYFRLTTAAVIFFLSMCRYIIAFKNAITTSLQQINKMHIQKKAQAEVKVEKKHKYVCAYKTRFEKLETKSEVDSD